MSTVSCALWFSYCKIIIFFFLRCPAAPLQWQRPASLREGASRSVFGFSRFVRVRRRQPLTAAGLLRFGSFHSVALLWAAVLRHQRTTSRARMLLRVGSGGDQRPCCASHERARWAEPSRRACCCCLCTRCATAASAVCAWACCSCWRRVWVVLRLLAFGTVRVMVLDRSLETSRVAGRCRG